ncbi:uncharacterized protein YALI1_F15835g [Yarrowia lipolytica]|uniref:Uncharacterized protein n=1 Tax=Yarrowia lipolytica TaxID=4952 RepID=A0A1D8NN03_YARLL|nr:hypothetical protein YALI1_F15835g [Yarrowia lipolytica]
MVVSSGDDVLAICCYDGYLTKQSANPPEIELCLVSRRLGKVSRQGVNKPVFDIQSLVNHSQWFPVPKYYRAGPLNIIRRERRGAHMDHKVISFFSLSLALFPSLASASSFPRSSFSLYRPCPLVNVFILVFFFRFLFVVFYIYL